MGGAALTAIEDVKAEQPTFDRTVEQRRASRGLHA
jgi:hypothetical protein